MSVSAYRRRREQQKHSNEVKNETIDVLSIIDVSKNNDKPTNKKEEQQKNKSINESLLDLGK